MLKLRSSSSGRLSSVASNVTSAANVAIKAGRTDHQGRSSAKANVVSRLLFITSPFYRAASEKARHVLVKLVTIK